MTSIHDQDDELIVPDLIDNPVLVDAEPPVAMLALKHFGPVRSWVIGEAINSLFYPFADIHCKPA